ncbi:MAG: hypothetical protein V1874_16720 [Spirochaetota bacterium]
MKKYVILLLFLIASCSSLEKNRFENANVYINSHLQMSELNRIAILEGIVILGMNPCESIAAVGEPYSILVKNDPKLPSGASLSDVVKKQCRNPDNSKIIFYYNNSFQYGKEQNYSVTYVKGTAVRIKRGDIKGGDTEEQD